MQGSPFRWHLRIESSSAIISRRWSGPRDVNKRANISNKPWHSFLSVRGKPSSGSSGEWMRHFRTCHLVIARIRFSLEGLHLTHLTVSKFFSPSPRSRFANRHFNTWNRNGSAPEDSTTDICRGLTFMWSSDGFVPHKSMQIRSMVRWRTKLKPNVWLGVVYAWICWKGIRER